MIVLLFLAISLLPPDPVQIVPGALVLLVVPGYGLGALMFGGRAQPLSIPSNIAIVVGLSILFNGVAGILFLAMGLGLHATLLGLVSLPVAVAATLRQHWRDRDRPPADLTHRLGRALGLVDLPARTRSISFALLAGALVLFGTIAYLAALPAPATGGPSLAVTGPDGSSSSLPRSGTVNQSLAVQITMSSPTAVTAARLTVHAAELGSNATGNRTVPWSMPLHLGANVTSSTTVPLGAGTALLLAVTFTFPSAGSYVVSFDLTVPGEPTALEVEIAEAIR